MEKAGFGSRFFAWFLDGIFIGILAFVLALVITLIAGIAGSTDSGLLGIISAALFFFLFVFLLLFQFIYFGYYWSNSGQTIGMKLLNIKVVRRSKEDLSFLRAGFRGTIGYWISALIFYVGYIWAAFDAEGETWHDKLFDTHVVKA